ncbi:phosphonate ABC transporter, permease protein PhnE [Kordiimonas marina]|uniref:phosphonate ABC transporter, permease protein PhnE n=1 Tax=Kordiimonas marina TaxID=2872312 RepID=UPI001FF3E071|nr:phosphonate ABC transporter, permease protein PhnE [Kordiimonas marina]MCJ9430480.1 phosphonate ABC transporter, permease protein PhnE [Kordiimonas marina]
MSETLTLLASFFPPDLKPSYLAALVPAFLETLGLVFGAMTLATLFSLPLALAVSMRIRGAGLLIHGLSVFRAVPDLTLAILCVIAFGLGPGAGLVALVLYYTAAMSKVFADLLETAPRGPVEALAATGASRLQVALYGLLPLTRADLFNYGAFAFECALRSSVIVGAVGGGGIGTELVGSLAGFDFQRATTQILMLVLLIAALDRLADWARNHPRALVGLIPFGLMAAWWCRPEFFALGHAFHVLGDMLPPSLPTDALQDLPRLVLETLWMAVAGTLGAAIIGLIAGLGASRRVSPAWLVFLTRRILELLRTIPEVVWGLVIVAVAGIGPVAGAWALGLHTFGTFGRLFADTLDHVPEAPGRAIASTGASRLMVGLYAVLPQSLKPVATHFLFRLEWNLRMATVLGLIGAGGIGQALYEAQQLFFYRQVMAYILVTAVLILAFDRLSRSLRARLNRTGGAAVSTGCLPSPAAAL